MNLIYNREEHRLRAFWRLLIHALLVLLLAPVAGGIILILVIGVMVAVGRLPVDLLTDPEAIMDLISPSGLRFPMASALAQVLIFIFTVLAYSFLARFVDRRPFAGYGFHFNRAWWRDLAFGLALGALLMSLIFLMELAFGWITITDTLAAVDPATPFWVVTLQGVLIFLAVGITEELLSRGYQLRNLAEGLNFSQVGSRLAVLISYLLTSAFFGALHWTNPNANPVSTLNLMLAGLFLGLGFVLTGELAIPIGLHITWNFFQGRVFGFPVSGLPTPGSFLMIDQGGPDLWTGGAFGPEAGLIGILALLLGSLLIWGWVYRTRGEAYIQADIAEYERPFQSQRINESERGEEIPPIGVREEQR